MLKCFCISNRKIHRKMDYKGRSRKLKVRISLLLNVGSLHIQRNYLQFETEKFKIQKVENRNHLRLATHSSFSSNCSSMKSRWSSFHRDGLPLFFRSQISPLSRYFLMILAIVFACVFLSGFSLLNSRLTSDTFTYIFDNSMILCLQYRERWAPFIFRILSLSCTSTQVD